MSKLDIKRHTQTSNDSARRDALGQIPVITFKLSFPLPGVFLELFRALSSLQTANWYPLQPASQGEDEGSFPLSYAEST